MTMLTLETVPWPITSVPAVQHSAIIELFHDTESTGLLANMETKKNATAIPWMKIIQLSLFIKLIVA